MTDDRLFFLHFPLTPTLTLEKKEKRGHSGIFSKYTANFLRTGGACYVMACFFLFFPRKPATLNP